MFTTLWANTYSGCLNQILGVEENRSKPYNFLNWKHSTGYRASGLSRKAACSRRAGLPRKPWRVRDEYSGGFLRGSCGNVRERVGGWTCVDLRERIRIRILKKMICRAHKSLYFAICLGNVLRFACCQLYTHVMTRKLKRHSD